MMTDVRSALALVLTALLVACGGSSEQRTPSEVHFDLQRAEALAGLALLQAAEI